MTQTTFTDNVMVDGSQDTTQLRVQGHTTQTQPLQTWENSAGTPLARVSGDGNVQIGDDLLGWSTPDALVEAHRAETSTTKPKRGFHSLGVIAGTVQNPLNALVQWLVGELELRGSEAINALHTALRIRASNMNTGTPTANAELRGADIEVINDASAGAAALTKATGLQVGITNAPGKTITEAVGVRVKMPTTGITNPFALYVEGVGVVHFEDYLEMKRPASVPGTPGLDNVRVYSKADGKLYAKDWNGVEYDLTGGGGGGSAPIAGICDGRLTLSSGVPIPVADVLAAATLYFTPFRGNQVALYNGTAWALFSFTERSLSLASLLANTLYDLFIYDNAGTLTLEAVAWNAPASGTITSISNASPRIVTVPSHTLVTGQLVTITGNSVAGNNATWRVGATTGTTFALRNLDDSASSAPGSVGTGGTWQRADQSTTRATALVLQDGVYVKSGATARRYLGTLRIGNTAGQSEDSEKKRYLYNEYNQAARRLKALESLSQWTYTTNAWRAARNHFANRVEVVIGNVGPLAGFDVMVRVTGSGAGSTQGIGYDAVTAHITDLHPNIGNDGNISAHLRHNPDVGYHYYQWVENGRGVASNTVHGFSTNGFRSGMVGEIAL